MSWLYSQVLVEEYLAGNFLDGEQSVQSNGKHTQQAYCAPDKMTVFSRLSRFGMTFKPLMEHHGEELLTLYLEDFHAKTLVPQEKVQELMENEAECGEKWLASFVKYDPDSSLWKTHQCSLLGDLDEFSETWPQWGLMRDGECWEQRTLEQTIRGTESGLLEQTWPTPRKVANASINRLQGQANQQIMESQGWNELQLGESRDSSKVAYTSQLFSNGGNNNARISLERETQSEFGNDSWSSSISNSNSPQFQRGELSKRTKSQDSYASDSRWWETEPNVGRMVDGMAFGVDRLKAIGNGQVPLCAATAWRILSE